MMADLSLCSSSSSMSTHPATYSATDRVLSMTELIDLVFSFMSLGSNANNARVCKKWCEIALDDIWREVTDITCLLSLLAPLSKSGNIQKFGRIPAPHDWAIFGKYARRVRKLRFEESEQYNTRKFQDVFAVLRKHRPTLDILPNLHKLHWITGSVESLTQDSVVFLHDNIKTFTLSIPEAADHNLAPFFQTLVTRVPRLSGLVFKINAQTGDIENHLIELLHGLPELAYVMFPYCHLPSRIVEALSKMDHLVDLELDNSDEWAFERETGSEVFAPCLADGAFPSLRALSFRAHLGEAAQFMKSNFAPHALTELLVASRAPSPETSFFVQAFLFVLSFTCLNLEVLVLDFLTSTTELPSDISAGPIITYDAFRCICRPVLRRFVVAHPYPVCVTLDDINDIARNRPLLLQFVLNCDPPILSGDHQLLLAALVPFARHCPNMEILGLFFGASTSSLSMAEEDLETFKKPIALKVGTSDINEDVGPATRFLAQVCPLGCEIEVFEDWPGKFGVRRRSLGEVQKLLQVRETRWSQVQCMLPLLAKLCNKNKEDVKRLETKVKAMGEHLKTFAQQRRSEGCTCPCTCSYEDPICPAISAARMDGASNFSPPATLHDSTATRSTRVQGCEVT